MSTVQDAYDAVPKLHAFSSEQSFMHVHAPSLDEDRAGEQVAELIESRYQKQAEALRLLQSVGKQIAQDNSAESDEEISQIPFGQELSDDAQAKFEAFLSFIS